MSDLITQCTRCGAQWDDDRECCPQCDSVKPSPSPWSIEPFPLNATVFVRDADGCEVTAISILTDCDMANARLIAAAPELLEALQELGDWLAYGLDKPDGAEPTAEDLARCEAVAAKARAAIAKATGEQR